MLAARTATSTTTRRACFASRSSYVLSGGTGVNNRTARGYVHRQASQDQTIRRGTCNSDKSFEQWKVCIKEHLRDFSPSSQLQECQHKHKHKHIISYRSTSHHIASRSSSVLSRKADRWVTSTSAKAESKIYHPVSSSLQHSNNAHRSTTQHSTTHALRI